MLAWLRRLIVSVGIGGASYALMLGIMALSVVYDQEFEPIITFAFDAGRSITNWFPAVAVAWKKTMTDEPDRLVWAYALLALGFRDCGGSAFRQKRL